MVRGGEYIFGTAQVTPNIDTVFVIDGRVRGMNLYFVNTRTRAIEKITGIEFSKIDAFNRLDRP
jgi:hypothetical protein